MKRDIEIEAILKLNPGRAYLRSRACLQYLYVYGLPLLSKSYSVLVQGMDANDIIAAQTLLPPANKLSSRDLQIMKG